MSIVKTFEEWKQTSKYEELLLSLEGQDDCDECCDATGRAAWDAALDCYRTLTLQYNTDTEKLDFNYHMALSRAEAAEARAAKLEAALNLALPIMKEDEEVAQRSFLPNPSRYDEELLTRYADAITAAQAALPATPTQENTHGN
jgi:hypothetical protein